MVNACKLTDVTGSFLLNVIRPYWYVCVGGTCLTMQCSTADVSALRIRLNRCSVKACTNSPAPLLTDCLVYG